MFGATQNMPDLQAKRHHTLLKVHSYLEDKPSSLAFELLLCYLDEVLFKD